MSRRVANVVLCACVAFVADSAVAQPADPPMEWTSQRQLRIILRVDPRHRIRSNSPVSVGLENVTLTGAKLLDLRTVEVIAIDESGRPRIVDASLAGNERYRAAHRIDSLFGSDKLTLNFVMPDHRCDKYAVYFDPLDRGDSKRPTTMPDPYHGLIGDGDYFREPFQRREIAASHFDQFVDFDRDGDLDLFQGGVEPYVYCYENVGQNRLVPRGWLSSGGEVFKLPCSKDNRSWVTVAFYDLDHDGDQDFVPSFGDGPDAGKFVYFENKQITSVDRGWPRKYLRTAELKTVTGEFVGGGKQAGGWFPSIAFVRDWDGAQRGRLDAIVGSNHHGWLYRGAKSESDNVPRFEEPVALQADGKEIELTNPRFETGDVDGDGDLDLLAGTQPGPVWLFENTGTRVEPKLAKGRVIALDGRFLIGDAHSGVTAADFDRDGHVDLAVGRFWERTDLNRAEQPREFGGFFRNAASSKPWQFVRTSGAGPHTEQFQICDAVRQNGVRAVDWDQDGKMDLLAGDTDGFIWFFRNLKGRASPLFANGEKLQSAGRVLSVAETGGHARFDVCDWNNDGKLDLFVADGQGTLTLFEGSIVQGNGPLQAGVKVHADGMPIQILPRASVMVCDWDHDGNRDIVVAGDRAYRWHRNRGTNAKPELASSQDIRFAGRDVNYVRPNLGSFVDWDGDGKRDFIGCHFENSIRLYRDVGSGAPGKEPEFQDEEGIVLLKASSPQMISGVDAIDWNGDGDLDLLTGQGHGGSGLRFFERDWIEDEMTGTHPVVSIVRCDTRPAGTGP